MDTVSTRVTPAFGLLQHCDKVHTVWTRVRQPVAEVLAYLHVQISPISCMQCCWVDPAAFALLPVDGGGGTPLPVLLTGEKKSGVPDELRATV